LEVDGGKQLASPSDHSTLEKEVSVSIGWTPKPVWTWRRKKKKKR